MGCQTWKRVANGCVQGYTAYMQEDDGSALPHLRLQPDGQGILEAERGQRIQARVQRGRQQHRLPLPAARLRDARIQQRHNLGCACTSTKI